MNISEENQYKISFTKDSIFEMDNIYRYITENLYNIHAAKNLMRKVENSIYTLKSMPRKYMIVKKVDELNLEYRRIVVDNFIIVYTIDEYIKTVYIVHIYYSGSNYLNSL